MTEIPDNNEYYVIGTLTVASDLPHHLASLREQDHNSAVSTDPAQAAIAHHLRGLARLFTEYQVGFTADERQRMTEIAEDISNTLTGYNYRREYGLIGISGQIIRAEHILSYLTPDTPAKTQAELSTIIDHLQNQPDALSSPEFSSLTSLYQLAIRSMEDEMLPSPQAVLVRAEDMVRECKVEKQPGALAVFDFLLANLDYLEENGKSPEWIAEYRNLVLLQRQFVMKNILEHAYSRAPLEGLIYKTPYSREYWDIVNDLSDPVASFRRMYNLFLSAHNTEVPVNIAASPDAIGSWITSEIGRLEQQLTQKRKTFFGLVSADIPEREAQALRITQNHLRKLEKNLDILIAFRHVITYLENAEKSASETPRI